MAKGFIRNSKSPWNCYGFYVNKHSELIWGVPRLVVNYKCEEEIKGLLAKGFIMNTKSPWNCYGFYVNKHYELIWGVPRLVVNYKPLKKVLANDTYSIPHKSTLVNRIAGAKIFSKFDLKSGF